MRSFALPSKLWISVGSLALAALNAHCSSDETHPGGAGGIAATGGKAAVSGGAPAKSAGGAGTASGGSDGGGVTGKGGAANPTGGTTGAGAPGSGGLAPSGGRIGGGAAGASGGGAKSGGGGATGEGGNPDGGTSAGATGEDGGGQGGEPSSGGNGGANGNGTGLDPFGITELYPSATPAARWTSEHWSGSTYEIDGRIDDNDPLELSGMRGTGTLEVTGEGELVMSGSQPRIYIYPGAAGPWKNVEVTVYYQRVEDAATAYAGLVVGARSGAEGHTDSTACDAHTYYARMRHDGALDFEKELEHPASATQSRVSPEAAWPPDGELPYDTWIGWKFVIYNLASGDAVKLEAYRDLENGEDGGNWVKVNETIDDGGWGVETDCDQYAPSSGEADTVILEGGVTFIRNTDVGEARYRWVSVREISVP